MTRKKILYLMHVPWGWIKQRPHFIAEGLSKRVDVKIVTTRTFLQKNLLKNEANIELVELFRLPFERFVLIHYFNRFLYRLQLKKYLKDIDIIWLTSPTFVPWIPNTYFQKKTIVYDCMDDFLEFPQIKQHKNKLQYYIRNENFLVENATILISSASYLKFKLISRYNINKDKIVVINNAIKEIVSKTLNVKLPLSLNYFLNCTSFKLVYIGTISSWMDFSLLKKIVSHFSDVEIFLFGPTEINIPQIEHVYYCGKVEHDLVFKIMDIADGLIMPFVINELIMSVNPVKLYEYIYSGKPSIAPSYVESLPFEKYVFLYSDASECIEIVDKIHSTKLGKADILECRKFCNENTWDSRLNEIYDLLKIE